MKRKLFFGIIVFCLALGYGYSQNLPENPDPGKCYVKCITKDQFKEVEETVEVHPSYTKLEIVPAVYKTMEEQVLIKEASKKLVYVPAVYETIEVPYISKEGRVDLQITPASFGSDVKTIEVYPKTSGWEYKQLEDCLSANKEDCVAACFVEYPAQYNDIAITTLKNDAGTNDVQINEERATYKKKVVKTPATTKEIDIPAEYSTIKRKVVETPAKTKKIVVPAKYETVKKTVLVKKGGITSWEEVDCELLNPTILPIFYQYDSALLTPASKKVIDETLLPLLKEKPVRIEIMSHTDSRGDDSYNMSLSQQRAQSVVNYLVSKGISRDRLEAKGYGETRLKNRCANGVECTEEQHQQNRRTEFRIIQ